METETHTGRVVSALPSEHREVAAGTAVQEAWAATTLAARLLILKRARHRMAAQANAFANAISADLARCKADTLVAEVLPLLAACKFLERGEANS